MENTSQVSKKPKLFLYILLFFPISLSVNFIVLLIQTIISTSDYTVSKLFFMIRFFSIFVVLYFIFRLYKKAIHKYYLSVGDSTPTNNKNLPIFLKIFTYIWLIAAVFGGVVMFLFYSMCSNGGGC